jgi:4-amino-4-deoxy-L-arabinose transferase-like glycosyltransferase
MKTGLRDHLLGLFLAVGYVAVLAATADDLAMSRDESFYVVAAESYGRWFETLFDDPSAALEQKRIDRDWRYNHEHPALMKSLFGLSLLAHRHWDWFDTPGLALRFPGMVTAGLLLWLIYIFGARAFDRRVGLFAALAFACLPRPFYHAHLNAFDVPIVLMLTWVSYCYWRCLGGRWWWLVWLGLAYGLALETKHNAWITPGVLLIHFVWVGVGERRSRAAGFVRRVGYAPWWLLVMATMGPILFVALWPWLWDKTWPRFEWYASFHLNHTHYNFEYLGKNHWKPPMPWHVPWVSTAFTVPLVTIVLSVVGLAARARAWSPLRIAEPTDSLLARRRTEVLWLGLLLAPLVVISLPNTPIFGGTKHWFPAYPFMCLFAGVGFTQLVDRYTPKAWPAWLRIGPRARHAATVALGGLFLAPAAVETAHSHPFGLAYYTPLAGGIPGAADLGMNRQFWGYTHGALAGWLAEQMPDGGSVWPCDATGKSWQLMQKDGMIPDNIRAAGHISRADFALVHHELHFIDVDTQIWDAYGRVDPVYVLLYDGVPLVSVYENPRRRR